MYIKSVNGMTTTVDIIWAVHNEGTHMNGYDLEDFTKALNSGKFNADFSVFKHEMLHLESNDYTFFGDYKKAKAFMKERFDKLLA